jgi:flagellar assembly factor FliW
MVTTETTPLQRCETRYFGPVDYREESVMVFPDGIPAFEQEKRFLALRQPASEPMVFLQSVANPDVCPGYRLRMAPEDMAALDLDRSRQPAIGRDVLCLTILSLAENAPPTVNLLAPIVVNLNTLRGRQAIQTGSHYSHREALPLRGAACS